ncbi:hypothetical protein BDR07DRAFT_1378489 [Suillus spraguei]|nr:hypothetical protein BDR07DRAFT_1378489 [Suillus spraguei]
MSSWGCACATTALNTSAAAKDLPPQQRAGDLQPGLSHAAGHPQCMSPFQLMLHLKLTFTDEAASSDDVAAATTTTPVATSTTTAPAATSTTTAPAAATTTTAPAITAVPAPDSQTVLALKEELVGLQTMVASLVERVSTGKLLLQEANRCLAEQEANAKLLADQVATLQQELNPAAESLAAEILPVVISTDATGPLAATTTLPEDVSPQDTDGVVAMEAKDQPASAQGDAPPEDTGADVEQESASIASTSHE